MTLILKLTNFTKTSGAVHTKYKNHICFKGLIKKKKFKNVSMLCLCCAFRVKRAVTVVNPLMGSGATPTSRSPQWAFMVGGYPVGS